MATVLIVEDEILLAECYARWLAAEGHVTHHVTDAQDAVDAVDDTLPDVILLDLLLSGANGIQVLHTLRSHTDFAHIPIILCSNALPQQPLSFAAYGVRAVLQKAELTRQKLALTIKEVLNAKAI